MSLYRYKVRVTPAGPWAGRWAAIGPDGRAICQLKTWRQAYDVARYAARYDSELIQGPFVD